MHEFHVVENLIENVITRTKESGHKKTVAINISLGKDSHIDDENLKFLMGLKCQETVAAGARINVKLTQGKNVFVESIDVE